MILNATNSTPIGQVTGHVTGQVGGQITGEASTSMDDRN